MNFILSGIFEQTGLFRFGVSVARIEKKVSDACAGHLIFAFLTKAVSRD